ncbi:MAG: DUF4134 family protein [Candidatus Methanomethylophilaceae archaeon]|jgi:hypothetical protein|nr:DUF4134 family protein [Candidatus Methanomethylophilaceae archaeon]
MKRITIAILIASAFLLTGAVSATAQNFQGLNTLQNIASEGQSVGKYAVNIAFVFSGIVGAICLIPAGIKFFKGEQQSKDAITSVGLGLIAIFIILAIIKAAMAFS